MEGFIVYSTYRIIENKAYVHLYGRLSNGESFQISKYFRPYFFIKASDEAALKKLPIDIKYEVEKTELKEFTYEPLVKIILDLPKDVALFRDKIKDAKIRSYEADVRFTQRFLIDHGINSSLKIEGEFKKGEYTDRFYEEPKLELAEYFPELKILSFDIETNPKATEIFSISLYTKGYEKVIIVSDKKLKNAISVPDEKTLLETFYKELQNLDPDVITGWNVIDFDLQVIEKQSKKYKLPFNLGRTNSDSRLRIQHDFLRESTADVVGRLVLDGIHLLKLSYIRLDDYKLDTAAEHFLGEKKLIGQGDKGKEIVDAFKNDPQKLVDYNLKDSELVYNVLHISHALSLTINRSLLTGMQLDKVRGSIASLDSLYLRAARQAGYVCSNNEFFEREERIKGGFVQTSIPGLYDNIVVVDFKSLYPSIIRTFNIDPLSFVTQEKRAVLSEQQNKLLIKAPNDAEFLNEDGLLPQIIQSLWKQRDQARKKKDEQLRYAIKIIMNSFFGVLANPSCRFYSLAMANAITHFGQHIIKLTAKKIEEMGYKVIYSDTDSAFVDAKAKNVEEAQKIGEKISISINKFYVDYVKNDFKRKSFLELEFEKTFAKFLMPKIRGSEVGAKKRYAGLITVDGKEKIVFTGLESARSDWTQLAKDFQYTLLDKIFHEKEVSAFVKKFVADLQSGKFDDQLVYRKKLTKPLESYTKTTPPHVKAARQLKTLTTNIVKYVMTVDGPQPIQQVTSTLDYDHYLEKQLKPIADTILSFYGKQLDDLLSSSKQTSLFGY